MYSEYREKEGQTHRCSILMVALSPPEWSNGIASHWSGKQVYQRQNINSLVFWELSEEEFHWPPFLGFIIHSPLCNKKWISPSVFIIFMSPVFFHLLSAHKTGHEEKITHHLVLSCPSMPSHSVWCYNAETCLQWEWEAMRWPISSPSKKAEEQHEQLD